LSDIILALFIAGYWFIAGYIFAWWTPYPYPLVSGFGCLAIGLVLLRVAFAFEDRGRKIPMGLGCALFAPPMTLICIGVMGVIVTWVQG
jgi:hypothetical protein